MLAPPGRWEFSSQCMLKLKQAYKFSLRELDRVYGLHYIKVPANSKLGAPVSYSRVITAVAATRAQVLSYSAEDVRLPEFWVAGYLCVLGLV